MGRALYREYSMQAPEHDGSSFLAGEHGAAPAETYNTGGSLGHSMPEGPDSPAADALPPREPAPAQDVAPANTPVSTSPDTPADNPATDSGPTADTPEGDATGVPEPDPQATQGTVPDTPAIDGAASLGGTDASSLPSFDIDIFSTDFLLPALFALVTILLWLFGLRQSRLQTRRSVLLFLALNGLTLTVCLAADYNLAGRLPDWMLKLSPLLWALLYLLVGGVGKRPLVWGSALATPGLWFFAQKLDGMYFSLSRFTMPLPQDPAWFLLIGVALFALMHVARIQKFWDDMEQPELTASFCYGMAGFWLLSLSAPSALAMFGLPVYAWMIVLLGLAAVGLWVARLLGDMVLAVCCGLGLIGVLYSYGIYVFGPTAA